MFIILKFSGTKRQRISTETDQDTGSESSPSSPRLKTKNFTRQIPIEMSPNRNGPPSSPESDLDVDSAPDDATPENLSLKKEGSLSPPSTPSSDNTGILRHAGNNLQGFLPYHQQYPHGIPGLSGLGGQRSPVDVLLR